MEAEEEVSNHMLLAQSAYLKVWEASPASDHDPEPSFNSLCDSNLPGMQTQIFVPFRTFAYSGLHSASVHCPSLSSA
jgi:hypothetical protein